MRTTATNSLSGKPFCPASVTPVDVSPAARMLMSEGLNSPEREPDPYLWAGIPNGLAVLAGNRVSRLGNGGDSTPKTPIVYCVGARASRIDDTWRQLPKGTLRRKPGG